MKPVYVPVMGYTTPGTDLKSPLYVFQSPDFILPATRSITVISAAADSIEARVKLGSMFSLVFVLRGSAQIIHHIGGEEKKCIVSKPHEGIAVMQGDLDINLQPHSTMIITKTNNSPMGELSLEERALSPVLTIAKKDPCSGYIATIDFSTVTDGLIPEANRLYWIIANPLYAELRGGHHHPIFEAPKHEFMMVLNGEVGMELRTKSRQDEFSVNGGQGIIVRHEIWHSVTMQPDAVLLVATRSVYSPDEVNPEIIEPAT